MTVAQRQPIAQSALDLIGRTPLVRLNRVAPVGGATVLGKLEARNPGGSVKDRIALAMIEDAERKGAIGPDRKSTRLNSSHSQQSRMPSSA